MSAQNFTYKFETSKPSLEVSDILIDPKKWWIGLHNEIITGNSEKLNDEFTFSAGNGVHYSVQKLIEVSPEKIVWKVIDSHLNFLKKVNEWNGTEISFQILNNGNATEVIFTHNGLIPQFECYDGCSNAWSQYLKMLENKLTD